MKVLVVDDDRVLADVVAFTLRREGYEVVNAYDGLSAISCWKEHNPDLIVLDVNLPKMDGFAVCQQIRQETNTPIIMLTVRGEEDDIILGLELGADDYIPKPFSPRQLVARARAVLRRSGLTSVAETRKVGNLSFNSSLREVCIGQNDPVSLTPLESRLLDYMIVNAGQVLKTETIIDHIWGPLGGDRDMLRQLIHRLRSKVEPDPSNPSFIQTIPGLGYGIIESRDID
jgi:DNA-binding response OmpR family regulator